MRRGGAVVATSTPGAIHLRAVDWRKVWKAFIASEMAVLTAAAIEAVRLLTAPDNGAPASPAIPSADAPGASASGWCSLTGGTGGPSSGCGSCFGA